MFVKFLVLSHWQSNPVHSIAYLSTHTVYQYKIQFFFLILRGYGHIGKWTQENIIFMSFCCCFKLSKKIEKLLNEQRTHAITKCTDWTCAVG